MPPDFFVFILQVNLSNNHEGCSSDPRSGSHHWQVFSKVYQQKHGSFDVYLCISPNPCFPHVSDSGCNARAVRQGDASPNPWEDTVNRFWQYISDINTQADGVLENLKVSQFNRELE